MTIEQVKGPRVVWLLWWDAPGAGTLWFATRDAAEEYARGLKKRGARIAGPYRAAPIRGTSPGEDERR